MGVEGWRSKRSFRAGSLAAALLTLATHDGWRCQASEEERGLLAISLISVEGRHLRPATD